MNFDASLFKCAKYVYRPQGRHVVKERVERGLPVLFHMKYDKFYKTSIRKYFVHLFFNHCIYAMRRKVLVYKSSSLTENSILKFGSLKGTGLVLKMARSTLLFFHVSLPSWDWVAFDCCIRCCVTKNQCDPPAAWCTYEVRAAPPSGQNTLWLRNLPKSWTKTFSHKF